jgi:hypothetical protein
MNKLFTIENRYRVNIAHYQYESISVGIDCIENDYLIVEPYNWGERYVFQIWEEPLYTHNVQTQPDNYPSWLIVNRIPLGNGSLEVFWVDELENHMTRIGDVFPIGRDVFDSILKLREYMAHRYKRRTWISGGNHRN